MGQRVSFVAPSRWQIEERGIVRSGPSWFANFRKFSFAPGERSYPNIRPATREFRGAFVEGDVATVIVGGEADGSLWVYTLIRRPSGWKVLRESWDDERRWAEYVK